MKGRRVVLAASMLAALAASVLATGGFTGVTADRGMDVSVADDGNAYLGIGLETVTVAGNHSDDERLATFTNRFEERITVDTTVQEADTGEYPAIENASDPGSVASGETATLTADVVCESSTASKDVTIEIDASGESVAVEATRRVTVDCAG